MRTDLATLGRIGVSITNILVAGVVRRYFVMVVYQDQWSGYPKRQIIKSFDYTAHESAMEIIPAIRIVAVWSSSWGPIHWVREWVRSWVWGIFFLRSCQQKTKIKKKLRNMTGDNNNKNSNKNNNTPSLAHISSTSHTPLLCGTVGLEWKSHGWMCHLAPNIIHPLCGGEWCFYGWKPRKSAKSTILALGSSFGPLLNHHFLLNCLSRP